MPCSDNFLHRKITRCAGSGYLANAIICMLDLSDKQLQDYRKDRISQQSIVGHYLAREQANDPMTKAVLSLARSKEWGKTMAYRGNWVHDQPPTVSGLGPIYQRHRRWVRSEDATTITMKLGLGIEDDPEYSIDELLGFVQPAVFQFVDLFSEIVNIYLNLISKKGIFITEEGLQVKIL